MKLSLFLAIKAAIAILFGTAFALLPGIVAPLYGIDLDSAGMLMARLLGSCLIGIGLVCWLERASEPEALRSLTLSLCIADSIGFVATLLALLSGVGNSLGWVNAAIWLLLAAGLGYYRFATPSLQD